MKSVHKLFAITASLVLLSSLSQAALLTNEFITAGGDFLVTTNWSLGVVPTTNHLGVIHNITVVQTNTSANTTTMFNNKTLLFSGSGSYSHGAVTRAVTATNANITTRNTSLINIANTSNPFTLQNSTLNVYDSSEIRVSKFLMNSGVTVSFNNTSIGTFGTALTQGIQEFFLISSNSVFTLNDSASVSLSNYGKLNIDASGAYMNFTSTGAVYRQYVGNTNTVAELNQMIVDGKIRANGAIVSTNNFKVTFASGVGTSVQLIPEPATAGLFGLAGAMVFLLRRQMKKKQTDEID